MKLQMQEDRKNQEKIMAEHEKEDEQEAHM
jgi:hypothetical protein